MAVKDITTKILADARKRVEEIESEAEKSIATIKENAQKKTAVHLTEIAEEEKNDHASVERAAVSRMKREARGRVGDAKRHAVERVITAISVQAAKSSDADYSTLLQELAQQVGDAKDITSISVPAGRVEVTKAFLAEHQITGDITEDETLHAGMILSSDTANYDMTLTRLIADKRKEIEPLIVEKLFA